MPKCASQESLHQTMRYSASRIATPYGSARPAWRERASECASWRLRAVSARCRRYSSVNTSSQAPLPSGTASVSEREAHWRSRRRCRTWWTRSPISPNENIDHPQTGATRKPVPIAKPARKRTATADRTRMSLMRESPRGATAIIARMRRRTFRRGPDRDAERSKSEDSLGDQRAQCCACEHVARIVQTEDHPGDRHQKGERNQQPSEHRVE